MKKIFKQGRAIGLICALLLCTTVATAGRFQQGSGAENKSGRIEALKIAFITQRLQLTPAEAEKFWPIFNSYEAELAMLRKNFMAGKAKGEIRAEDRIDFQQKKLDMEKRYLPQVEAAIGKEKAATLYGIEEEFRKKLRDLAQDRQQQRGNKWGR